MKSLQLSKPNLTIDDLKLIAIIAMLIDHLADMITSNDSIMNLALHTVGRITAPIMFFAAVEGYHKTHNLKRYLFRLTIFALISHIPFSLMFYDGDLFRLNVIYTILFGLIAIIARHKIKNKICVLVVISLLLALSLFSDWGYFGILIMLIFDFFYRNFKLQAFAYCLAVIIDGDVLPIVLSQARILNGVFQYTNGF
ncbi:MAG: TraX family protein [Candidatus Saccharibacteria bacterium]|nr:TraX family protein [Candidatus Saccharibacteria bacterium]